MQLVESVVSVQTRIDNYTALVRLVARLPSQFRPMHFSVGERVRNRDLSLVSDTERFDSFVRTRTSVPAGFDLVGNGIRYTFYIGATRNSRNQSTHVGCSILLRGRKWSPSNCLTLLKTLCSIDGVDFGGAYCRSEWEHRHLSVRRFPGCTVRQTLGVDMSASIPGLYWWTVMSVKLAARHKLDRAAIEAFADKSEEWKTEGGCPLLAFRLFESPDDWMANDHKVSAFLASHPSFFSLSTLSAKIDAANSEEALENVVRPYWAGAVPWEQ